MAMGNLRTVTISGSYRKFYEELALAIEAFRDLGVTVLSPQSATILSSLDNFVSLQGDLVQGIDTIADRNIRTAMTLVENSHLKAIQRSDALWAIVPGGYCGVATAFEVGWALAHRVPVFYDAKYAAQVREPVLQMYAVPTKGIDYLVHHFESMPGVDPVVSRHFLRSLQSLPLSSRKEVPAHATVAVGSVIVDQSKFSRRKQERDILLVRTHKWGGRFSLVGDRLRPGEKLRAALVRTVSEQTGLEGIVRHDVCAFDELPDSGYYIPRAARVFVDKVVGVKTRKVVLDNRAQEHLWVPPRIALRDLDLEPNARHTIALYEQMLTRVA